jgi:hypothetical protein
MARARSLLVPVLLLPVVLSSCGGGGPTPQEYVRAVCTATTGWQREIEQQEPSWRSRWTLRPARRSRRWPWPACQTLQA